MDKFLTVEESFGILQKEGITNSIAILRRWIRQGKLNAIPYNNRKDGYKINSVELENFINKKVPINRIRKWYEKYASVIISEEAKIELEKILGRIKNV